VRIVWLRSAERNLEEQLEYIGERNPLTVNVLEDKIAAAVAGLADHPRRGRPGRVAETRELVVPGTPFIAVYTRQGRPCEDPPRAAQRATVGGRLGVRPVPHGAAD
jgi:plasmid stabilization system protein ParE